MPKAVSLLVAREAQTWAESLQDLGAASYAPDGRVTINPRVRALITAMHEVLAGGDVAVSVTTPGDAGKKADLESKFTAAVDATSAIGGQVGPGVLII